MDGSFRSRVSRSDAPLKLQRQFPLVRHRIVGTGVATRASVTSRLHANRAEFLDVVGGDFQPQNGSAQNPEMNSAPSWEEVQVWARHRRSNGKWERKSGNVVGTERAQRGHKMGTDTFVMPKQ